MPPHEASVITAEQIDAYGNEGFLILRNAIAEADIQRLERGFARNPPLDGTLQKLNYPEPGRYTLANNCLKDSDLAFIVEHPTIVPAVTTLLGDEPRGPGLRGRVLQMPLVPDLSGHPGHQPDPKGECPASPGTAQCL